MCGGSFGRLFQNSGRIFGLNIKGTRERAKEQAERAKEQAEKAQSEVDGKQTKEENAAVAVRKRRASEVLSATDNGKKTTLGG
ncbi:hypothetical protein [Acinetobacter indicus]|uniref:hypothetical protein n=1 Tax=Acinetobacter indicus TaxID=756892 RepID=UPI0012E1AD6A|nr:hypothetical protein [Acinetobacter indicus]